MGVRWQRRRMRKRRRGSKRRKRGRRMKRTGGTTRYLVLKSIYEMAIILGRLIDDEVA